MKRIPVLSIIIFCAVLLSYAQPEDQRNSVGSSDMKNEMEDFIQYYRSLNDKSQARDEERLTPQDLLENDLIPRQGIDISSGTKSAGPAKSQDNVKVINENQNEVKKDGSDLHTAHTGVSKPVDPHNLWRGGQPLYKGSSNTSDQYRQTGTGTVNTLNNTVYRVTTYGSQ